MEHPGRDLLVDPSVVVILGQVLFFDFHHVRGRQTEYLCPGFIPEGDPERAGVVLHLAVEDVPGLADGVGVTLVAEIGVCGGFYLFQAGGTGQVVEVALCVDVADDAQDFRVDFLF